ncbi:thiamine biosynthesis protein ThiI [Williamsoniiplasma somnilux]|uniref:Probable tRNA sulfurtransferase n=1 Tax=Williamsoniiplasma somnilux TaxID=215578 RepID=A0A2K8NYE5_9MOLU|nr:tRNA uracil 4-sulfurtransferase ThiI [Williamsoniiplasma somnilux]ATZ18576.1 thiamine biosynthesis protein ThiI [Williamsoniiplasma somnilux]
MKNILVRYGELTLKGANRNYFVTKLINNIKFKLKAYKEFVSYTKDNNSLTLTVVDNYVEIVIEKLQTTFGIYSLSVIEKTNLNMEEITNAVIKIAQKSTNKRFKLEVYRKDKQFPLTSTEIKQQIAPIVLRTIGDLKVDVHNPNLKIEIVIKKDHVDIFDTRLVALKGLPVGVSGKGLSLLSGGIDSPVASFLTMKRGMQVDFIHFMTPPHTSTEALDKVFKLAAQIAKYNYQNFSLYVVDFSMLLQELNHMPDQNYKITLMRRMFVRIANKLAFKINARGIITGESLGQVASQTIESINVINSTSILPILRPVLTFDKEEIIEISKKINTYDISILPFDDVCSMFVPKNPITKPKLKVAEFNEQTIMWEEILEHTMDNLIKEFVWNDDKFEEVNK